MRTLPLLLLGALLAGCGDAEVPSTPAPSPPAPPLSDVRDEPNRPVSPTLTVREGGALVRLPSAPALVLADEDHGVVRRIPLPIDAATPPVSVAVPGRPAQVLGVGDRVLVTVRDPGLLVVLRDVDGGLVEERRVELPGDAWGVAVTADGSRALVTSAWTHRVSLVDLDSLEVRWSVDVAREPRGITVRADGSAAWVSHLVGTQVTKITELDAQTPVVRRVELPPDPLRAPWKGAERVGASLAYATVLSPEESRLFVARHALGGLGWAAWFGTTTVDVLATRSDEPLAPRRTKNAPVATSVTVNGFEEMALHDGGGILPEMRHADLVQPRAMVVRKSASTLLVASEGNDSLVELDAAAIAPALAALRVYGLAGPKRRVELYDERRSFDNGSHAAAFAASACGAPTGIALAEDEQTAYVYCRSTDGVAVVPLATFGVGAGHRPFRRNETYVVAAVAESPLPEPAASGRRSFYDAVDPVVSGGLGCAGCHPEGRDDGFVWHVVQACSPPMEYVKSSCSDEPFYVAHEGILGPHSMQTVRGLGRQTPMLAGRVSHEGPYGWLAESKTLAERIRRGFGLHRWGPSSSDKFKPSIERSRAESLAEFLRNGLVEPPHRRRAEDGSEARGRETFLSATAQCSACHDPERGYANGRALPLTARKASPRFDREVAAAYKVPSLYFVGSTPPYFHDGESSTLEELIEDNRDHMGMTSHLSEPERRDLVAFLRSIEPSTSPSRPADAPAVWDPTMPAKLPPDHRGPEKPAPPVVSDEDLPRYDATPFPEERSKQPSFDDWFYAPVVRLARSTGICHAKRIREWVRIDCGGHHLLLAGGSREDVSLYANTETHSPSLVFPVRRGDQRVIEVSEGWKWIESVAVLSEQWLDGDEAPTIGFSTIYSPDRIVVP